MNNITDKINNKIIKHQNEEGNPLRTLFEGCNPLRTLFEEGNPLRTLFEGVSLENFVRRV